MLKSLHSLLLSTLLLMHSVRGEINATEDIAKAVLDAALNVGGSGNQAITPEEEEDIGYQKKTPIIENVEPEIILPTEKVTPVGNVTVGGVNMTTLAPSLGNETTTGIDVDNFTLTEPTIPEEDFEDYTAPTLSDDPLVYRIIPQTCKCVCLLNATLCSNNPTPECHQECNRRCAKPKHNLDLDGKCIDDRNCTCVILHDEWVPMCGNSTYYNIRRTFGNLRYMYCHNVCHEDEFKFLYPGFCEGEEGLTTTTERVTTEELTTTTEKEEPTTIEKESYTGEQPTTIEKESYTGEQETETTKKNGTVMGETQVTATEEITKLEAGANKTEKQDANASDSEPFLI